MLGRLRSLLQEQLRSRGVPVVVEYGPAVPPRTATPGDVVVVSYAASGGDEVQARRAGGVAVARGTRSPDFRFVRQVAATIEVRAKATVAGARRQDHEDRAQRLVDQVLVALDDVLRSPPPTGFGTSWAATGGGFVQDPARLPDGATYELGLAIGRSVPVQPWSEEDPETFTLAAGSVASTTTVRNSLGEGAGDTACGGA